MKTRKILAVLVTLAMVFSLIPTTALAAGDLPFTDVGDDFWAEEEISWAYETGLMNGNTATTFNAGGQVTRQQVWMILARMSGYAPEDMAAAKGWAVSTGVSDGSNPGNPVTRQQLVTLIWRAEGEPEGDLSVLADYPDAASVSAYAQEAMAWAVENGVISGTAQGTLNPQGTANRAQLAVILYRFCGQEDAVEGYTVTFKLNYGDKGTYKTVSAEDGKTVSAPTNPTRSGYSFKGWYTKAENGTKFDFTTKITEDITLYAQWTKTSSGGGGGGGSSQSHSYTYTPLFNKTHTVTCSCGDITTEACTLDANNICTKCGVAVPSSAEQLHAALVANLDVALTKDIDLAGYAWTSVANYSGTLDGNGYTLANLEGTNGLFASITGGTVKDLIIADASITNTEIATGILAARIDGGAVIEGVTVSGTVTSSSYYTGGLIGAITGSATTNITNCVNNAAVASTGHQVGGIVGCAYSNVIFTNCVNNGNVNEGGGYGAGGIVGFMTGSSSRNPIAPTLINCTNNGVITGAGRAGGIAGSLGIEGGMGYYPLTATIQNCTNSGAVNGMFISDMCGAAVNYSGDATSNLTLIVDDKTMIWDDTNKRWCTVIDGIFYLEDASGNLTLYLVPADYEGTTVNVAEGTTTIGGYAFAYNSNIEKIVLPSTVTTLEDRAFRDTSASTVVLNEGLTNISWQAFRNASNVTSVVIPSTVTTISKEAFQNSGIKTLTIPATVTTIAYGACRDMFKLETVTIESNADIPVYAFRACTKLRTVILNGDNVTFGGGSRGMIFTNEENGDGSAITVYVKNENVKDRLLAADTAAKDYSGYTIVIGANQVAEGVLQTGTRTYEIISKEGLLNIADLLNEWWSDRTNENRPGEGSMVTVNLSVDVDLSDKNWTPIESMWVTFNGKGHTISNLTAEAGRAGFFGYAGGVTINNLTLNNVKTSGSQAGTFAGSAEGLKVNNCYLTGNNTVTFVAGVETWNGIGAITGVLQNSNVNITITEGTTVTLNKGTMTTDPGCVYVDNLTGYISANNGTITNNGKISVSWTVSTADGLKAAIEDGATDIVLAAGTYTFPASSLKAGVTLKCAEGTVFEGKSSLDINGATVVGATFSNPSDTAVGGIVNGTFKDCVFEGVNGLRWCYAGDTVVFENCVFSGSTYGIHFDGGANDVMFKNCTFSGFNAMGGAITKLTMENCTFVANDKSNYNGINLWGSTEMKNCTFVFDGTVDYEWVDACGSNKTYTFTDCVVTDGTTEKGIETVVGNYGTGNTIIINGNRVYIASAYDKVDVLADAVANGATEILLTDGEYDLNGIQKDGLTLIGVGNDVKMANTTNYASNGTLGAITRAVNLKNVTITNTVYTMENGGNATFTNVTFAAGFRQGYGKNVVFTDCTFGSNSEGYALHFEKADSSEDGVIELTGCEFEGGKVHLGGKRTYEFTGCDFAADTDFQVFTGVTLKDCTVDGEAVTAENVGTLFPDLIIANVTIK